jgi:hypothetical protein
LDVSKTSDEGSDEISLSQSRSQNHSTIERVIPSPDVEIDDKSIYVNRPFVQQLLLGKQGSETSTIKPKPPLTEEQKKQRARRLKIMEIERKKALKAARKRLRMNKTGEQPIDELAVIPELVRF